MNREALNHKNHNEDMLFTDVIIVGAGPVGLFAVFQCGMLGLKAHVIDALPDIGGQCAALYPEKPIYDIPGFPQISGAALIENLEAQAAPFAPTYHLDQRVEGLTEQSDGSWIVETTKGTQISGKAIILAAGAGAFGPNRPPLEDIEDFEGKTVHYMVRERTQFKGKRIVIGGGGDSAIDWALSLSEVAKKVHLVHRRDKFRAAQDNVRKIKELHEDPQSPLEILTPYQLDKINGQDGKIESITIKTLKGEERTLEADYLLPFYGIVPDLAALETWGMQLDGHQICVNPASCETTKSGIFAVGDVAHYEGKLKLILTGFSEVAQAAHEAFKRVNPDTALHFEHSTTKGIPQ